MRLVPCDPSKMSIIEMADYGLGWEDIAVILRQRLRTGYRGRPSHEANISSAEVKAYVLHRRGR